MIRVSCLQLKRAKSLEVPRNGTKCLLIPTYFKRKRARFRFFTKWFHTSSTCAKIKKSRANNKEVAISVYAGDEMAMHEHENKRAASKFTRNFCMRLHFDFLP